MSAWINCFAKRKENIPPEARGDAEWCGAAWRLFMRGISGRWGEGHDVSGVGWLGGGARSWDLHAFLLVFLLAKIENINGNCERGCEGKSIPKKSI